MTTAHHHRNPMRAPAKPQQGHALTEFIVLSVALVPLFLLMPLIGKYQDMAHSTLAASRYAAFDRVNRYQTPKPQAQLEQEVRRRFFSTTAQPIKSNDLANDVQADQNPLWRDPTNRPLIAKFSDIVLSTSWSPLEDFAVALNRSGEKLIDLPKRDIYTATISVPLINLPEGLRFYQPFDKLNLQIKRHTSVQPDPWTASGPGEVLEKLDQPLLVPLRIPLRALKPLVDPLVIAVEPKVPAPNLGGLDFWSDQVPQDRIKAAR